MDREPPIRGRHARSDLHRPGVERMPEADLRDDRSAGEDQDGALENRAPADALEELHDARDGEARQRAGSEAGEKAEPERRPDVAKAGYESDEPVVRDDPSPEQSHRPHRHQEGTYEEQGQAQNA